MLTLTISTFRPAAMAAGLLLFLLAASAFAQAPVPVIDPSTAGRTYVLAYPDTVSNILDARFPNTRVKPGFSIYIYSATAGNKVRISMLGSVNIVTPDAGVFMEYAVNDMQVVVATSNRAVSNVIRVEADKPVILYCYFATTQSSEAWTPIPVEMWGTQYNVASYPASVVNDIGIAGETAIPFYARKAPAEATIIAAYDNTQVTINPHTRMLEGNPLLSITLNRNQAYQIQSDADTNITATIQPDIAGISISSNRPIGVLSGNTRTLVRQEEGGLANNIYKNMLMEWLAPVDQQGKTFVYMPTRDSHDPDSSASNHGIREGEAIRVIGNSFGVTKGSYLTATARFAAQFSIRADSLEQIYIVDGKAASINTSSPAQVMMMSNSITKFEGSTPCFRGLPCLTYSGWAPYMVDLTPREQWTSFAPFIAPRYPLSGEHYVNVATDSGSVGKIHLDDGSLFPFKWPVPGTGMVWGSMKLVPGATRFLIGEDGARFGGFVYGLTTGAELYRPGRPKKKGEDDGAILGGSQEGTALHPCEYEEYSALSYGYPLSPRRNALVNASDLGFDSLTECSRFWLAIRSLSSIPAGLRSIELESSGSANAKLIPINPAKQDDIIGIANADVEVVPIDSNADATGIIIITDRAGKVWRIPFVIRRAGGLLFDRPSLDFGRAGYGIDHDTVITITNTNSQQVLVRGVHLVVPGSAFEIVRTQPAFHPTVTLAPGGTLLVTVRLRSQPKGGVFIDSLLADVDCGPVGASLRAEVVAPDVHVTDPTFGNANRIDGTQPVTGSFTICNTGKLPLTLHNPNGGKVIEWSPGKFSIPDSVLTALDNMVLAEGECVTVKVIFPSSVPGIYKSIARVWASTRDTRDTSVWTVEVSLSEGVPAAQSGGYSYDGAVPNPFRSRTEFRFTLAAAGHADLTIYNAAGEKVATIADGWMDVGPHSVAWDAAGLPSGRYFCRINSGTWHGGAPGEPGVPPISVTLEK
ncbi:MAG: IgGFc-binding protein [Chlorobi bacterium]|nr:IgGFc-binding protein [Chlorobiota bacterium]